MQSLAQKTLISSPNFTNPRFSIIGPEIRTFRNFDSANAAGAIEDTFSGISIVLKEGQQLKRLSGTNFKYFGNCKVSIHKLALFIVCAL